MPHKFVMQEKPLTHPTNRLEGNNVQKFRMGGGLPGIQAIRKPLPNVASSGPAVNSCDVKVVHNPNDPLDLTVRPKGEVQYVRLVQLILIILRSK